MKENTCIFLKNNSFLLKISIFKKYINNKINNKIIVENIQHIQDIFFGIIHQIYIPEFPWDLIPGIGIDNR